MDLLRNLFNSFHDDETLVLMQEIEELYLPEIEQQLMQYYKGVFIPYMETTQTKKTKEVHAIDDFFLFFGRLKQSYGKIFSDNKKLARSVPRTLQESADMQLFKDQVRELHHLLESMYDQVQSLCRTPIRENTTREFNILANEKVKVNNLVRQMTKWEKKHLASLIQRIIRKACENAQKGNYVLSSDGKSRMLYCDSFEQDTLERLDVLIYLNWSQLGLKRFTPLHTDSTMPVIHYNLVISSSSGEINIHVVPAKYSSELSKRIIQI